MTLLPDDPAVLRLLGKLAPYARETLERAAEHALRLHAREIAPEHVLTTLLRDESAGGTRLVLHAFADPDTLASEIQAMSPGVMVVGARQTLPFSVRGVRALERSRAEARAAGAAEVDPAHVFLAAWRCLEEDQVSALETAGARITLPTLDCNEPGEPDEAPLLCFFSDAARRSLAAARRLAHRRDRAAIGPAHMLAGALEVDAPLCRTTGLTVARLQTALADRDADETLPERRLLAPDLALRGLLDELPEEADTVALLGWSLRHGSPALRELFRRQKVTVELFETAGDAFGDP